MRSKIVIHSLRCLFVLGFATTSYSNSYASDEDILGTLKSLCGERFEGQMTFPPDGRPDTSGMTLHELRNRRDSFEEAAGDRPDDARQHPGGSVRRGEAGQQVAKGEFVAI